MARAHSPGVKDANYWIKYTMSRLTETFVLAGVRDLSETGPLAKFEERLVVIVNLALRLQHAIGEAITSMDLEFLMIPPKTPFDPSWMEDTYASDEDSDTRGEIIVATTELGLKRVEQGLDKMVLVKPKVILRSALEA
jgi:hypothetical protein